MKHHVKALIKITKYNFWCFLKEVLLLDLLLKGYLKNHCLKKGDMVVFASVHKGLHYPNSCG